MAKVDVKKMAEEAVSDAPAKEDVITYIPVGRTRPMAYSTLDGRVLYRATEISELARRVDFPSSITDQTHGQSIADMVRQGQGVISDEDMNNFDDENFLRNGRAAAMSELEWADPAERYESELNVKHKLSAELKAQIARQKEAQSLQKQADKAASTVVNETVNKQPSNPVPTEESK